jgi:hypothetical protein
LAQKVSRPPEQLEEIHSSSAQDRIDPVAFNAFETVAIHSMLAFQMTDARFDGCPAFHPPPKTFRCPSTPAFVYINAGITAIVVSTVAHVSKSIFRFTNYALNLLHALIQGVTIVWIAVKRLGSNKPTTATGSGYTDLATELIALVRFAFTDTLYFRGMYTVDFVFISSLLLINAIAYVH